ncbi:MAG: hypothetical protein ABI809_08340 [Caldimonas sp.]
MKAAPPGHTVDVTVRVDLGKAAGRFDEIVLLLEGLGLADAAPHPRFGIVNGSVPVTQVAALRGVAGVTSVREDKVYGAQAR